MSHTLVQEYIQLEHTIHKGCQSDEDAAKQLLRMSNLCSQFTSRGDQQQALNKLGYYTDNDINFPRPQPRPTETVLPILTTTNPKLAAKQRAEIEQLKALINRQQIMLQHMDVELQRFQRALVKQNENIVFTMETLQKQYK